MVTRLVILFGLILALNKLSLAQQYTLYNSRTMFDSFENPSQKAFRADSSFNYAFTFFIPGLGLNSSISGPATDFFRGSMFGSDADVSKLKIRESEPSVINANMNTYLLMFKVFPDVQFDQEYGVSWQIRNDTRAEITNAMLVLAKDNQLFVNGANYYDIVNGTSYSQAYHQISFTYRRNHMYNGKFGWGVKLSYLDGINYQYLKTTDSYLNRTDPYLKMRLEGVYRSNHAYDNLSAVSNLAAFAKPSFKNPGASITLSANLRLRGEWLLIGNLKDFGFIDWNNGYEYALGLFQDFTLYPANTTTGTLANQIENQLTKKLTRKSFTTLTNGKVEFIASKDMDFYQPTFIFSKSLIYPGSDWVFVNNFRWRRAVFSISADYNGDTALQFGGQFMIQSPNFEFYLGSTDIVRTVDAVKGFVNSKANLGGGTLGASFYMGLGIKFGHVKYHHANSPTLPGFN